MKQQPARILIIHNSADIYGASRSLVRLLRAIDRTRFEPVVLLPSLGQLANAVRDTGTRVLVYGGLSVMDRAIFRSPKKLLGFFFNLPVSILVLWRLIRREKVDLVHSNTAVILSPGPAAKLAGIPHVWHIRDWFQEFKAFWKVHQHYMRIFSSQVIAVSEAIAAQFGDRSKVRVIHNGFDVREFVLPNADAGENFRAAHGLNNAPVVGCVGRIKLVRKGQEHLLHAAVLLKKRGIRARWLIVGAPFPGNESHLEELQRIASEGGIAEDVCFTGEIEDPKPAYAAMNIFVLPSAQPEPFGGVVMEAMCMRLPVVATAIGGSLEQVDDGKTGYLVPPADAEALADKLELLLRDPELARRMGEAGRRRVAERFTTEQMVQKITGLYETLLA